LLSPSKCSTSIFSFAALGDDFLTSKKDESGIQSDSDMSEALQKVINNSEKQLDFSSFSKFFGDEKLPKPQHSLTPELRSKYVHLPIAIESKRQPLVQTTPFSTSSTGKQEIGSLTFSKVKEINKFLETNKLGDSQVAPITSFYSGSGTFNNRAYHAENSQKANQGSTEDVNADTLQRILSKYLSQQAPPRPRADAACGTSRPQGLHSKLQDLSCASTFHPLHKEPVSAYLRSQRLCRSLGGSVDLERSGAKSPFNPALTTKLHDNLQCTSIPQRNKAMYSSLTITSTTGKSIVHEKFGQDNLFGIEKRKKTLLRLNSGSLNNVIDNMNSKITPDSGERMIPFCTNMGIDLFQAQPFSMISPKDSFLCNKNQGKHEAFTFGSILSTKEKIGEPLTVLNSLPGQLGSIESRIMNQKKAGYQESISRFKVQDLAKKPIASNQFSYPQPIDPTSPQDQLLKLHDNSRSSFHRHITPTNEVFYWPQKTKERRETVIKLPKKNSEYHHDIVQKETTPFMRSFQSSLTPVKTVTIDFHSNLAEKKSVFEPSEVELRSKVEDYLRQLSDKAKARQSTMIIRPQSSKQEQSFTNHKQNVNDKISRSGCIGSQLINDSSFSVSKIPSNNSDNKKSLRSVTFDFDRREGFKGPWSSNQQDGGIRSILKKKSPSTHSFSKYLEMEKSSNQIQSNLIHRDSNSIENKRDSGLISSKIISSQFQRETDKTWANRPYIGTDLSNFPQSSISGGYLGLQSPPPQGETRAGVIHAEQAGPKAGAFHRGPSSFQGERGPVLGQGAGPVASGYLLGSPTRSQLCLKSRLPLPPESRAEPRPRPLAFAAPVSALGQPKPY
jgi:hypothetical protein